MLRDDSTYFLLGRILLKLETKSIVDSHFKMST